MVFFNPRLCIILKTPCSVCLCGQIGYTVIRIVSILVRTSRSISVPLISEQYLIQNKSFIKSKYQYTHSPIATPQTLRKAKIWNTSSSNGLDVQ
ncbi:hypothetical protein QTP88_004069 [Uroleucon formosanum]